MLDLKMAMAIMAIIGKNFNFFPIFSTSPPQARRASPRARINAWGTWAWATGGRAGATSPSLWQRLVFGGISNLSKTVSVVYKSNMANVSIICPCLKYLPVLWIKGYLVPVLKPAPKCQAPSTSVLWPLKLSVKGYFVVIFAGTPL